MAEIRLARVEQGQTRIRSVPIAVTPEGFWCCPSPAVFQKTAKSQNPLNKPKSTHPPPPSTVTSTQSTSSQRRQTSAIERKPSTSSARTSLVTIEQKPHSSDTPVLNAAPLTNEENHRAKKVENAPRKVAIEFGEPGTSDLNVTLLGKQGVTVKLSVHRSVLMENSSFFANKILEESPVSSTLEIDDCDDVEIYVETIGFMYCKDLKQRLIKQSVSRVLRILKVAETLGFTTCIDSCLEYLEAVPWVGEEEEEKVLSTILRLKADGVGVNPILKRVSSNIPNPPKDTLPHILELVLKSTEERGRREMKSIVLKLLRENNTLSTSSDLCNETIYTSCTSSLDAMLSLFRQAADINSEDKDIDTKSLALEADNLLWLLDILADRHSADEFAVIWSSQQELASLHAKLPIVTRHHVSMITARLFVGIGRGEILPSKDTRLLLLQTWLEALINDYGWLRHGCRSFDRTVVEEGIGRTILTVPLEDQRSILLSWLGSFLKAGDNCPNLQKAFEVWWRRTFIRPFVEPEIVLPMELRPKVDEQ